MSPFRTLLRAWRRRSPETKSSRPRAAKPAVEALEDRTVPSLMGSRTFDGTGNNLANPLWGSAGIQFLRQAAAAYADGASAVGGEGRPSARVISNALAAEGDSSVISDRLMSAMIYAWGQFLDHDLDLTLAGGQETMSIPVPAGDPWFDPSGTGTKTLDTHRSVFDPATGLSAANPRQQLNAVTAWIDGSMIYGSDRAAADSLRTFASGRMKTSAGNLLPMDANGFFLAGDIRVNENPELISLQTLFVREHNWQASELARRNPGWSDEQLYQEARARVIAEVQAITYNQWLPALLGPSALGRYQGYQPGVNPGISNEFATAGFRLGHSLLGDEIEFLDNQGRPIRDAVSLADAFFKPELVRETGIDAILKYLASDPSSELDNQVVDSVRNFLFGPPGAGGLDLASLNIQRGRDHGLADYNAARRAYGLPAVASFAQIARNPETQRKLQELYGSVDNIDLWVGALAEDHVPGGSVGPTVRAILADQFGRLRAGDRFWYERNFAGQDLQDLRNTTLTDILRRNTALTNLQQDSFFFKADIHGIVFADANRNGRRDGREGPLSGRQVALVDAAGAIIARAVSDSRGMYRFDVASGLRTGQSRVVALAPDGSVPSLRPGERLLEITRGDQFVAFDVPAPPPGPGGGSRAPLAFSLGDASLLDPRLGGRKARRG